MNKKLVALAVGGAFALPLAAQAQTANVTLYGRANVDFELVNGRTCQNGSTAGTPACSNLSTATPANQIVNPTTNRLSSNSSRFGLRGTESLGGGLNAVFQLESNVSWDTGNSSSSGIASRETFVGLQGSWGRFVVGKFLAPEDDIHAIFGNVPTLLTSILSTADLWAQGNLNKAQGGFDARLGNSLRYDTPNFSGFTGAVQYSTRDDTGNTTQTPNGGDNGDHPSVMNHANVVGANLIYNNGPLQVGAALEINNKVRDLFATGGPSLHDTDWTIAGSYNFGTIFQSFALQIGLVYEQTRYDVQDPAGTSGSGCTIGTTNTCSLKRNFGGVSATIPAGGGKFYGFWGKATNGRGSAAPGTQVGYVVRSGSGSGQDTGSQQWEISYSYNLSPRTLLYAGYVKLVNQCKSPYTFNINAYPIAVGTVNAAPGSAGDFCSGKPGGGVLGIVHFF